jgi:hypothetical protein
MIDDDEVCPIYYTQVSPDDDVYDLLERKLDGLLNPPKYYCGVHSPTTAVCLSYQSRGEFWDNPFTLSELFALDGTTTTPSLDMDCKLVYCLPECLFGRMRYNQPCIMQFGDMDRGYFLRQVVFQKLEASPSHCWETEDGEFLVLPAFELEHLSFDQLRLLGLRDLDGLLKCGENSGTAVLKNIDEEKTFNEDDLTGWVKSPT